MRLSEIATRRPNDESSEPFASVTLGGITLYASRLDQIEAAVKKVEDAIEGVARAHFLLARSTLEKLTRERLRESVPDRLFGAVLGKTLRLARIAVIPCLTINGRLMRTYLHSSKLTIFEQKLGQMRNLLLGGVALSTDAAQSSCFPAREWGSSFAAKQLLGHLAFKGEAVFVDNDLFAATASSLENAPIARR